MPGKQLIATFSGCALGLGVGLGLYWWHKRSTRECIPSKWHEVGKLEDLMCYPIKSCAVTRLPEFDCTVLGLQKGLLRDRVFMVVDEQGKNVTGRMQPKLTQVFPTVDEDYLILKTVEGGDSIKVSIPKVAETEKMKASVWGQSVQVVDCGDEVAEWLSNYILNGAQSGLRLVYYYHSEPSRPPRANKKVFWKFQDNDVGALPDFSSYMLMNKSSVADLNNHLTKPVTANFFRPNFLVAGSEPYEEDKWEWVKIGETVFRVIKPCNRCVFTTVDPETGIKDKNMEPLKTLKTYRQERNPKVRPHVGDAPVLGIHLALRTHGSVKLSDAVYVNYG